MPIVSHADKENAQGAPEQKKYNGLTAVDFNKLPYCQQNKFLDVLIAKDDGEAQLTALEVELKEISKDSEDTLAESEEAEKAIKAKMAELQKEATRAGKTGRSARSTFEATKSSLSFVECAIIRKKEADQSDVEIKKLEEQIAAEMAERAKEQKRFNPARALKELATSLSEADEQTRADPNVIAAAATYMAAIQAAAAGPGSASGAGPSS